MKVVVIGGVAAGMSAAAKLRRMNREAQIVVYEKGDHVSYGACGLPYFISGENEDARKLIARTKEEFAKSGITVKLFHEVIKVVPEKKQVLVKNLQTQQMFIDFYDKLMIATGTKPFIPPIPGLHLDNIYTLKTMGDGRSIKEKVESEDVRDVVIVGGGYIGVEVAEAMVRQGKHVRLIELGDRILRNFEPEITAIAEEELRKNGVSLHLREKVIGFTGEQYVTAVQTDKGTYPADLVILAIGVKPATEFLADSGISLAENGAIIVDREMRTNIPDIFAAGDCAQVYHKVMEENSYIPLGTNANKCGRLAGSNIAGERNKYIGTLGSAAVKIFDMELGRTGLTEADAQLLKIDYDTVFVESMDHPDYYPNPTPIWIKLIYEKRTKRILGAHAIGNKGVVLRIDVFAVAIHNEMTTDELGMTDFCYAPPFAGVWDAIHIACNAAK